MKKIAFLIFCLVSLASFLQAQELDVLHYKFELRLSDKSDTIEGVAVITGVRNRNMRFIRLNLHSVDKTGKGMKVSFDYGNSNTKPRVFIQK